MIKPLTKTEILNQLYHTNQKIQNIIDGKIYEKSKQSTIRDTSNKLVTQGQNARNISTNTTNLLNGNIQGTINDSSTRRQEQENIEKFLKLTKQKSLVVLTNPNYPDTQNNHLINQNYAQNAIIDIRNIFQSKFSQRVVKIKFALFLGILATGAFAGIVYGFKLQDKISNQLSSYIAIIFLSIIALNLMIHIVNNIHTVKSIKNLNSSMGLLSKNLAEELVKINKSNDSNKNNQIQEIYKIYSELAAINHLACEELKNRSPFTIDQNKLSDRQYQSIDSGNNTNNKTLKEQLIFNFIATTSNHESFKNDAQKQNVISLINNIIANSADIENYLPNIKNDKKFEYQRIETQNNQVGHLGDQEMKLKQGTISNYFKSMTQFLLTAVGLPQNTAQGRVICGKKQS